MIAKYVENTFNSEIPNQKRSGVWMNIKEVLYVLALFLKLFLSIRQQAEIEWWAIGTSDLSHCVF